MKLVKLAKLGRKLSKGFSSSKFHEFHANTSEFQDEFWPSFTSFTCLCCFGAGVSATTQVAHVWAEVQGKSLQSLREQTVRSDGRGHKETAEALKIASAEQTNRGHGPLKKALRQSKAQRSISIRSGRVKVRLAKQARHVKLVKLVPILSNHLQAKLVLAKPHKFLGWQAYNHAGCTCVR